MLIDNSNLLQMCRDCGAAGFIPAFTYAYDATAETVTVTNASTIPGGDAIKLIKARVHDYFGNDVLGSDPGPVVGAIVINVADLNRSKPLALTVTISTTGGIIADGGAYGLLPAGDVAHWDVEKNASVAA